MSKRTIRFHFFRNPGIGSFAICARMGSVFSHVGVEFEDETFYHSTFRHGNVKTKVRDLAHAPTYSTEVQVTEERYQLAKEYAESIVGKKYDYRAIIGFIFARQWQNADALFCSELGGNIFEIATGIRVKQFTLLSPGELQLMVDVFRRFHQVYLA